jgi:small nuclear ribonucleoprotein (snRNP)-like protein
MDTTSRSDPPPLSAASAPSSSSSTATKATRHINISSSKRKSASSSAFRSLGRMLKYLDGQVVSVELKNGIRYTGMLDSDGCDDNFNVTLRDAGTSGPHHQHHHKNDKKNHHHRLGSSHQPRRWQPREERGGGAADVSWSSQQQQQQQQPHPAQDPSTSTNSDISSSHLSVLQIRGSNVRYILLGDLDLDRIVSSGLERERKARAAHQRPSLKPKKETQR